MKIEDMNAVLNGGIRADAWQLLQKVERLNADIDDLRRQREKALCHFAAQWSPFKVGDVVDYSANMTARRLRINEVRLVASDVWSLTDATKPEHVPFAYAATQIRKDGSDGRQIVVPFYHRQWLAKVTP